jgi:hypothetical protein
VWAPAQRRCCRSRLADRVADRDATPRRHVASSTKQSKPLPKVLSSISFQKASSHSGGVVCVIVSVSLLSPELILTSYCLNIAPSGTARNYLRGNRVRGPNRLPREVTSEAEHALETMCTIRRLHVHVKCAPSTSDLAILQQLTDSGGLRISVYHGSRKRLRKDAPINVKDRTRDNVLRPSNCSVVFIRCSREVLHTSVPVRNSWGALKFTRVSRFPICLV